MTDHDTLHKMRHSASHVLAMAVLDMFPEARLGTGPALDDGFYYDFALPRALVPEDLPLLEKKMKHIIKQNLPFTRYEEPIDRAKEFLRDIKQDFKVEIVSNLEVDGESQVSFYKTGEHFVDLCAGPHVDGTKAIGAVKLTKFSSAYWRGDETRDSMQRIYGVVFETEEELTRWSQMMEEAKKRDHRKLGKELDLFTFSDLIGPGLPLFTPKGTVIREMLSDYLWKLNKKNGYAKVDIPHLAKPELYKTSGHWDKYKDDGFHVHGRDKHFMLKPMNCPHHTQIYASNARSYRDLPIRYFEVTKVYRDEQSGEVLGLSRVISITQDDGHVFCRADQIGEECARIVSMIKDFYSTLGMLSEGSYSARLSVRDPATPDKYLGDHAVWDMAESKLAEIGQEHGLALTRGEGEAAFYGPKLDFMFRDAIGREWQLATIQLDFVQPERFGLEYTDTEGKLQRPVMIHRAITGSLERFISVMIEHFAGAFPSWLAPVQACVVPVSTDLTDGAKKIADELRELGFRVTLDDSTDSLGKKVRSAEKEKIPYILVVGQKEIDAHSVTVRIRGEAEQPTMTVADFAARLRDESPL